MGTEGKIQFSHDPPFSLTHLDCDVHVLKKLKVLRAKLHFMGVQLVPSDNASTNKFHF